MRKLLFLLGSILYFINATAQPHFPYNGVFNEQNLTVAYTNANIVIKPGEILKNATLLVSKGKIIAVGAKVNIPKEAIIKDMQGMYLTPAFIDVCSSYGLDPDPVAARTRGRNVQLEPNRSGAFGANDALKSDQAAYLSFQPDEKSAEKLRANGFGLVLTHVNDGISRGSAALVNTAKDEANNTLITNELATFYSFNKGASKQSYPASLMGSIALLRQFFLDAKWYKENAAKLDFKDLNLEAFLKNEALIKIFEADGKYDILRAAKIAKEAGYNFVIKGNGQEYQYIESLKGLGTTLIIPLNFPKTPDVEDPIDALALNLERLRHWELAPGNPKMLKEAGIPFVLTAHGLKSGDNFFAAIRKTIAYGFNEADALAALTTGPAKLLGISNNYGTLEVGKTANFLVSTDSIFSKGSKLVATSVSGKIHPITPTNLVTIRGKYELQLPDNQKVTLNITETAQTPKLQVKADTSVLKSDFSGNSNGFNLSFTLKNNTYRWGGVFMDDLLLGLMTLPNGKYTYLKAKRIDEVADVRDTTKKQVDSVKIVAKMSYPFSEFGNAKVPQAQKYLIKNATVWTMERDSILQNTDVLIEKGKIIAIGKDLKSADAIVIDGTGKHLTPGLIDEHSHIAIARGVNEGTNSITSEVRIGDVVNPDDINIFRQLAGGVTTSHLLHGSANSIGGQTILIKLRWGQNPEAMKFEGAPGFIKFALGENVKQSNWGDAARVRFPQTRMGVEQVMMDGFTQAKAYKQAMQEFQKTKKSAAQITPRRDLRWEALVEILEGNRNITCHSYVQSEINMLMKVADSLGFKVNTFTHILEGYKVADKMKAHGAGASTFADWWAYKYEVIDAIPQNPEIMHQMGIITAINSDDAEMGRRLNQEAAKSMKYGNMNAVDALKMVTLNPAKLLKIDQKVGSIKIGKDADLVLWDDFPLSIYAKVTKTWVDGILYFDIEMYQAQMERDLAERKLLIDKMLKAKKAGEAVEAPVQWVQPEYHCDSEGY